MQTLRPPVVSIKLVSTCCNAHFRDRKYVLEALLERALQRTTSALASAGPDTGAAPQALERLIAASWQQLARNDAVARAATELSPDAIRQAHQTARNVDHALLERGRHEGTFRTDLPPEWLLTALQGLIHAAEAVRTGELEPDQTLDSLATSTHELWGARTSLWRIDLDASQT